MKYIELSKLLEELNIPMKRISTLIGAPDYYVGGLIKGGRDKEIPEDMAEIISTAISYELDREKKERIFADKLKEKRLEIEGKQRKKRLDDWAQGILDDVERLSFLNSFEY